METRTVVVTGGGTGIGRAIARSLAAAGDLVVIVGRREKVLAEAAASIQSEGGRVCWRSCDIGDPAQVDDFAAWLRRDVSKEVDVLVNNAGGTVSSASVHTTADAADYARAILSSNLVGDYLMVHALRPALRRPGGRIINLSSIAAYRGGGDMYSAAKAGLIGLTYSLAGALGPEGITVNAIAPGLVLETEFFGDQMSEERRQRTEEQTPLRRAGRPDDIAAAVRYLASANASFVTGEVLHVNGGWVFGR